MDKAASYSQWQNQLLQLTAGNVERLLLAACRVAVLMTQAVSQANGPNRYSPNVRINRKLVWNQYAPEMPIPRFYQRTINPDGMV